MELNSEQRLWVAVVNRALKDLNSSNLNYQKEAKYWLLYDLYDFPLVSAYIGIDFKKFRIGILKYVSNNDN